MNILYNCVHVQEEFPDDDVFEEKSSDKVGSPAPKEQVPETSISTSVASLSSPVISRKCSSNSVVIVATSPRLQSGSSATSVPPSLTRSLSADTGLQRSLSSDAGVVFPSPSRVRSTNSISVQPHAITLETTTAALQPEVKAVSFLSAILIPVSAVGCI